MEDDEVVKVLQISGLEVNVERVRLGGEVEGIESKVLLLADGRDAFGDCRRNQYSERED